jgi:hypothetical protein
MRRTLPLIVCLAFAFLSFVPLSAPVAAQQQLPAGFVGRWQGTMVVRNPDSEFPFTLDLTGGSVGANVGTADYPAGPVRAYPCGGDLVLRGVSSDRLRVDLVEKLTYGQAYCSLFDATISLTLQTDGSLAYRWSHPGFGGTATATLVRTSAPPAAAIPVTVPPPAAQTVPPATALSGGNIVLADDFSDPARSVLSADSSDPSQRSAFDAGKFVLQRLVTTELGFNVQGVSGPYADASVAVSARLPSGAPTQYVGLGCRMLQTALGLDALYALVVFPAVQTFGLIRADNGQSTVITPWATSPAINSVGAASNRLELSCVGDTIAARINGVDVASVQDATYQSGGAVLLVGNNEAGTAEARFDDFQVTAFSTTAPALVQSAIPAPRVGLPAGFVGRWEGTTTWDTVTMPVVLNLTGGSVGQVVGTIEYALYGSAGPTCGGNVSLVNMAADGGEIVLEGLITYDATVCLIDATIQISFQDTGDFGYLWNHPTLTVSGTGTLVRTIPTN